MRQVYIRSQQGCKECDGKGVMGRTKAGEIIITDNKFLSLALDGDTSEAVKYWIEELGGRTLKESATELMLKGIIGADELERWVGLLDQPEVY
jgi:type II secretory ATPase GspE/PulE/Tfp pilus assembly ATPase PilB-like protein